VNNKSKVYLVGAGPGDTGLITVKGLRCLQQADVVLYDKLSNPAFLQEAPDHAQLIYVGKMQGTHAIPQDKINQLLVEKAQAGNTVVRLKGGDPYIFGRGGEEAQLLAEAGVPFEVVPGITSGFAAAAYAGIPLTHRDFTTSVSLITGHGSANKNNNSHIDWHALSSGNTTLVFYMGLSNISTICQNLIANGRPEDTPVAIISQATTARQRTLVATLGDAPQQVASKKIATPALIIVGQVVNLRKQLSWFDTQPLFGRRILIPCTPSDSSALSAELETLGAETISVQVVEHAPPSSWDHLDLAIINLAHPIAPYTMLVVRNPTVVTMLWLRLRTAGKDMRALAGITIVAADNSSAEALSQTGLAADYMLKDLTEQQLSCARILCPGDETSGQTLNALQPFAAQVAEPPAYRTVVAAKQQHYLHQLLKTAQLDGICLTCSASTKALAAILGDKSGELLASLKTVALDRPTQQEAQKCGFPHTTVANQATYAALIEEFIPQQ